MNTKSVENAAVPAVNWKEVAGKLYGAVDSLETQVEQMKGYVPGRRWPDSGSAR